MPAHIYIRVGRYNDAIEANEHAVHADEQYIADQRPSGLYPVAYYPHNYHFLAFAATLAGRSARAIEAARAAASHMPVEPALAAPELQLLVPYVPLTLATFGRWEDVLREPLPPPALRVATGLAYYARGLAFAATSRWADAAEALDTVMHASAEVKDGPTGAVLAIATHALRGEIAARRGQSDSAIAELRTAMRLEDELGYMEPPYWHAPIRRSLGALLLRTGQPMEAAALYREDLQRFPENGWSLFGLARSLAAQGRTAQARAVEQRFANAWRSADVRLAESGF
jgi:tetratricopeptide (TPR) repeat protein